MQTITSTPARRFIQALAAALCAVALLSVLGFPGAGMAAGLVIFVTW
jgi:hypothetical protein